MDKRIIQSLSQINYSGNIAVYGAGSFGQFVLKEIQTKYPTLIPICFIDDNKVGEINGLPILNFDTFVKHYDSLLVIVASSYWRTIQEKLDALCFSYIIADILNEELKDKVVTKAVFGTELNWYTPNRFLLELVNNIPIVEPNTNAWLQQMKGACFYDVGASCGLYSILASLNENRIFSFEPNVLNLAIFKKNLYLNNSILKHDIVTFNVALSSRNELAKFDYLEFGDGYHSSALSNELRSSSKSVFTDQVICYDLDSFIKTFELELPTHIKIDVDGAESVVLSGMKQTLSSSKLREVLVESSINSIERIINIMSLACFKLCEEHDIFEITGAPITNVKNYLFKRN